MNPLTAKDHANKRMELAKYSREQLSDLTIASLRKLGKSVVPGLANISKKELIESILEATHTERILAVLIPNVNEQTLLDFEKIGEDKDEETLTSLGSWTSHFYQDLRQMVQSKWDGKTGLWSTDTGLEMSSMGYRIINYLASLRNPKTGDFIVGSTQLRYRTVIHKTLDELVSQENGAIFYTQLASAVEQVKRASRIQMLDMSKAKADGYKTGLADRKTNKLYLDFQPFIVFADTVLSDLDNLKFSDWSRVSMALVIVTGRRPNEIHTTTTIFEFVGDYEISFTGQSKVKGRTAEYFAINPAYDIPTLVKADNVVKGLKWLKDNNKQVDNPVVAHNRYSKDLSAALKRLRLHLDIDSDKITYKALRALYAQACLFIFKPDDDLQYLAGILGHGRGNHKAADSKKYEDFMTPQSYNSDFIVTSASLI